MQPDRPHCLELKFKAQNPSRLKVGLCC